jgi:hypothetical protein
MRRISLLCSVLLFGSAYAFAACGGQYGGTTGYCSGNSCFGSYEKMYPPGNNTQWTSYQNDCCGTIVTLWVSEETGCYSAPLSAEKRSAMELLLNHGIGLLRTDCTGHLVRYTSPKALESLGHRDVARSDFSIDLSRPDRLYVKALMEQGQ